MPHIVILVAWYICNPRQQRLAWHYSSSTAVVPLLWNATILLVYNTLWINQSPFRDRYPSTHCAHAWICSWYLLLVYTRSNSNPTAVPCAGNITLFAHKEHNHGFPDFPVQQYSYFLISIFYQGFFILLVLVKHSAIFIYTGYIIPYVLEYYSLQFYTHLVHIYVIHTYSSIRGTVWYDTYIWYLLPGIYLVCVRQTYTW